MTIKQINHQQSEKLSALAVPAEMTDELLEEALITLTPELEGWREGRGNKDGGILRLVMRIHEPRCSLAWIELQAWVIPVETQINSAGWNRPTLVSRTF
jgi:hypothetical protein